MKKLLIAIILLLSVAVLSSLSVKKNTGEYKERSLLFSKEHEKIEKFQVSESEEYIDVTEVFGLINGIKIELKSEQVLKNKQKLAEYKHRVKEEAKKRKLAEEERVKKEKERQEKIRQRELNEKPVLASRGEVKQNGRVLTMETTFYTAFCPTGCVGRTATGLDVSNTIYTPEGLRVVAVDPNTIPLYSIVQVFMSDGTSFTAQAMDTGGDIKFNRLDILVSTRKEAYQLGRQQVTVKILREGK